jgi:hypothetical protein
MIFPLGQIRLNKDFPLMRHLEPIQSQQKTALGLTHRWRSHLATKKSKRRLMPLALLQVVPRPRQRHAATKTTIETFQMRRPLSRLHGKTSIVVLLD